jgi:hypothetical protein
MYYQRFNDATMQRCNDSTIQRSNDATIQQFNNSTIQRCNDSTMQRCNDATIQQFNNPTMQRCNDATNKRSNSLERVTSVTRRRLKDSPSRLPGEFDLDGALRWCRCWAYTSLSQLAAQMIYYSRSKPFLIYDL